MGHAAGGQRPLPGQIDPSTLKAGTLDNRVRDANLHGQLQGGQGHFERSQGDATAQGLPDAVNQSLMLHR